MTRLSCQSGFRFPGALWGLSGIAVTLALSSCSAIPDLSPEALAANKSACESVTTLWGDLGSVLESGDIASTATTLLDLPESLRDLQATSTDPQLDDALQGLLTQVDVVVETGVPDVSALAGAGAELVTRCAVFGVIPDLTLPGM